MKNISKKLWDVCYFVSGRRDACFVGPVADLLNDRYEMTRSEVSEYLGELYESKYIDLMNSQDDPVDWGDDDLMITVGKEGWSVASEPRPSE